MPWGTGGAGKSVVISPLFKNDDTGINIASALSEGPSQFLLDLLGKERHQKAGIAGQVEVWPSFLLLSPSLRPKQRPLFFFLAAPTTPRKQHGDEGGTRWPSRGQ